jgi:hypothetical protein
MPGSDDLFADEDEINQFAEEFDRHREAIFELVSNYMEEAGVSEPLAAHLLLESTVQMRMAAYGTCVESPSVAGLKRDLDRLCQDMNSFAREAKKGAEEYIRQVKALREELAREEAEEAAGKGN